MLRVILFLSFLIAAPAWAVDVALQSSSPVSYSSGSDSVTHTISVTVDSGSAKAMYVFTHSNPGDITGIVFNTDETLAAIDSCVNASRTTELFRLVNPTSTTADVVITVGTSDGISAEVYVYDNVDPTTPEDDTDKNCTSGSSSTLTLTSASDGACIDGITVNSSATGTAEGADQTEFNLLENIHDIDASSSRELATVNCVMSWTWDASANRTHIAVALNQGVEASTAIPRTQRIEYH